MEQKNERKGNVIGPLQMSQNYFGVQGSLQLEFFDGTLRKIKVVIITRTRALIHTETYLYLGRIMCMDIIYMYQMEFSDINK